MQRKKRLDVSKGNIEARVHTIMLLTGELLIVGRE